jgi:hypothetical protein
MNELGRSVSRCGVMLLTTAIKYIIYHGAEKDDTEDTIL